MDKWFLTSTSFPFAYPNLNLTFQNSIYDYNYYQIIINNDYSNNMS